MRFERRTALANEVAIVGIPFDDYSSHLKGASQAPDVLMRLLEQGSLNGTSELGVDLVNSGKVIIDELVDLSQESPFACIESKLEKLASTGVKPMVFGGDHSITYPIIAGLAKQHTNLTIVHFDAHPDLYDEFQGNRLSHACPFARIMEAGLAKRLIQIGIRTLNQHQREQADRFGVEVYEMRNWQGPEHLQIEGPVYVSIDLDALDPAYAPGVSHHEPGGMSVRQVIDVIHHIQAPIIGADIVEYNPTRDINDMTGMVALKLFKELAGKMLKPD